MCYFIIALMRCYRKLNNLYQLTYSKVGFVIMSFHLKSQNLSMTLSENLLC